MNKEMIKGIIRHGLTVIATAIIANSSQTLESAVSTLIKNISSGDINSIVGTILVIVAILWSMWGKASDGTKETVINTMMFRK